MKPRIINLNYFYDSTEKLTRSPKLRRKPWAVFSDTKTSHHRTHAKAMRQACKLAKKRGKK